MIAEAQAIAGASIPQTAQLAADKINVSGGVDRRKIEIISYDNQFSTGQPASGRLIPLQGPPRQPRRASCFVDNGTIALASRDPSCDPSVSPDAGPEEPDEQPTETTRWPDAG